VTHPEDGTAAAAPHRVLVVSADMGGGHNATAAAVEEAVRDRWPGSEIRRLDALDVMGPGIGRLFRGIYVGNVETTPWLYEFFYSALWRHRWFSRASKRFTGSWCGRRLVSHLDRFDPDVIVSTYPLGSSGLAWLRRHRGLRVPVGCVISDFAPHPFWVYPEADLNLVVHESAVPVALAAEPDARVEATGPVTVSAFRPGDQADARRRTGLRSDALVVLVSCGSYAFGDVEEMTRRLTGCSDRVQVVVACGRDTRLQHRLQEWGASTDRLSVWGWTDQMPQLVQAADLVVSNAGGATVLEALASGVPVVTATPIAAHGRANADLMTQAGLTELCDDLPGLTALVATAARDRSVLEPLRHRTEAAANPEASARVVQALIEGGPTALAHRHSMPWRMRPADALFGHVEDSVVRQELGAVLELEPDQGSVVTGAGIQTSWQPRMAGLPPTRRVLVPGRLPGWRLEHRVRVADQVRDRVLGDDRPGEYGRTRHARAMWRAVGDFWSETLPPGRPAWQGMLVRGRRPGRQLLAVKMHHCQGDGISALGLLDRLTDPDPGDRLLERQPASDRAVARAGRPGAVATALALLSMARPAPRHPLNDVPTTSERDFVGVPLPWPSLRHVAARLDVAPHEVVVTLVGEVLDRLLRPAGLLTAEDGGFRPLRAMVPVAVRPARLDRITGNWTGTTAVDLPMGEMSFEERLRAVHEQLGRPVVRAQPYVSAAVVKAVGLLPPPVRRPAVRAVYGARFFNTVVSFMPGARGPRRVAGARVRAVYPVLPLARHVPLAIGVVVADQVAGLGVLLDRSLGIDRSAVTGAVRAAFVHAGGDGEAFDRLAGELVDGTPPGPASDSALVDELADEAVSDVVDGVR
jgi:UDP-N-acetylglucosamine:LPS N-acetylglucosamine transferase